MKEVERGGTNGEKWKNKNTKDGKSKKKVFQVLTYSFLVRPVNKQFFKMIQHMSQSAVFICVLFGFYHLILNR